MEYLIQQLINGIQLGTVYALIALGYTMVYGIVRLINNSINSAVIRAENSNILQL